jgi:hypothetical protein
MALSVSHQREKDMDPLSGCGYLVKTKATEAKSFINYANQ